MRRARFRLLLCFVVALVIPAAVAAPATETLIGDCIEAQFRSDGGAVFRDTALNLVEVCPDLARALRQGADPRLGDITPRPGEKMTLAQLQDLRQALASYRVVPSSSRPLDRKLLEEVLAESYQPVVETPREPTWFERFNKWLESFFEDTDPETVEPVVNWLEALGLTDEVLDVILQVSVLLLITLTLGIIFNELRAGGAGGLWQRLRYRATRLFRLHGKGASHRGGFSWSELRRLEPRDRVVTLLQHELDLLVQGRQISRAASRTNREIAHQLDTAHSPCAEGFRRLLTPVERTLYGDRQPDEAQLREMETIVRECEARAKA